MPDRNPLSVDRWKNVAEPEFTRIRSSAMSDIARTSRAIHAIGRILHNAIGDEGNGITTLDSLTMQELAGGIECLSDFLYELQETESFDAAEYRSRHKENGNG